MPSPFLLLLSCLFSLSLVPAFGQSAPADPLKLADPMVGTVIFNGTQYPGAALPFSLVKLSPDTAKPWTAGYNPAEPIVGFSHTHIAGTSATAFAGQILIRPQTGPLDVTLTSSPASIRKRSPAVPGSAPPLNPKPGPLPAIKASAPGFMPNLLLPERRSACV